MKAIPEGGKKRVSGFPALRTAFLKHIVHGFEQKDDDERQRSAVDGNKSDKQQIGSAGFSFQRVPEHKLENKKQRDEQSDSKQFSCKRRHDQLPPFQNAIRLLYVKVYRICMAR